MFEAYLKWNFCIVTHNSLTYSFILEKVKLPKKEKNFLKLNVLKSKNYCNQTGTFLLDINSFFFSPAFSLFNVVTFQNDACTSTSITTNSGARSGQCFTAEGKSFGGPL